MTAAELARRIDHTALKPETTLDQIVQLCREAVAHNFAAVCVNPVFVTVAAPLLQDTDIRVCTVVGFPLGASTTAAKVNETREAMRMGAREIDMVIWIGGLKSGKWDWVEEDVARIAGVCNEHDALLKVILECALLTDDEKLRACELCVRARAHFVKTSTGFAASGAVIADVQLMASVAGPAGLGVKAAGGIRSYSEAVAMLEAGATRIGTSSGVRIVEAARVAGG